MIRPKSDLEMIYHQTIFSRGMVGIKITSTAAAALMIHFYGVDNLLSLNVSKKVMCHAVIDALVHFIVLAMAVALIVYTGVHSSCAILVFKHVHLAFGGALGFELISRIEGRFFSRRGRDVFGTAPKKMSPTGHHFCHQKIKREETSTTRKWRSTLKPD